MAAEGDGFVSVELPKTKGANLPWAHSVVTEDLVDEPGEPTRAALDQVLQLFVDRLGSTSSAGAAGTTD